ncbi:MAG TPA: hopanoid-associated sugar epimerase [Burkholderiales bacterium]|nr:hopanoid-associated sugar epimerase [Burkholderiales bacterium]
MDATLVTGASGFVGSALAHKLVEAGRRVRALVRPASDRRNIDNVPVELAFGDLADLSSLERALDGCSALFHVAADYRLWARNPQQIYRTNVAGTANIMQAALKAGVERIVYTSSVATLGLRTDGTPADENTPVTLDDMIGHYKRSKFLAEAEVKRMITQIGLPAVIVNPSTPVGPRDIRPTPTGRMVLDAACGRSPAYVDTGLNLVHVDDVAQGHMLAFERGKVGERYILGGRNMTLLEILIEVARITGQKPPRVKLAHNLVLPIAYLSEAWAWLSNGPEPRATVDGVRLSKKYMYFSIEKARRELGYNPGPVEKALQDAVTWFRANGYCGRQPRLA